MHRRKEISCFCRTEECRSLYVNICNIWERFPHVSHVLLNVQKWSINKNKIKMKKKSSHLPQVVTQCHRRRWSFFAIIRSGNFHVILKINIFQVTEVKSKISSKQKIDGVKWEKIRRLHRWEISNFPSKLDDRAEESAREFKHRKMLVKSRKIYMREKW